MTDRTILNEPVEKRAKCGRVGFPCDGLTLASKEERLDLVSPNLADQLLRA